MNLGLFKNVIFKMCLEIKFNICIKKILHEMIYNGRYAIKPNESTNLQIMYSSIRINRIWR